MRGCSLKRRTCSGRCALGLESFQPLFHELYLHLEIVDLVHFGGNSGDLIGQDLDIGRIVAAGVHGFGCNGSSA